MGSHTPICDSRSTIVRQAVVEQQGRLEGRVVGAHAFLASPRSESRSGPSPSRRRSPCRRGRASRRPEDPRLRSGSGSCRRSRARTTGAGATGTASARRPRPASPGRYSPSMMNCWKLRSAASPAGARRVRVEQRVGRRQAAVASALRVEELGTVGRGGAEPGVEANPDLGLDGGIVDVAHHAAAAAARRRRPCARPASAPCCAGADAFCGAGRERLVPASDAVSSSSLAPARPARARRCR